MLIGRGAQRDWGEQQSVRVTSSSFLKGCSSSKAAMLYFLLVSSPRSGDPRGDLNDVVSRDYSRSVYFLPISIE